MATGFARPSDSRPPLTARSVVKSDFQTVRRGFDPEEVNAHLGRVAEHVADLESRIQQLEVKLLERERVTPPEEAVRNDAYEGVASRIADLVKTVDRDIERLRGDAEADADRLIGEAKAEAERLRTEAQREADDVLSTLRTHRDSLLENVRRLREGLARTLASADSALERVTREDDVALVEETGAEGS